MITAIDNAFKRAESEGWFELYIAVDIHGTIFPSTYDTSAQRKFFPGAKSCLKYLSSRRDIKLFLFSCSSNLEYLEVLEFLKKHDISFDGFGSADVVHIEDKNIVKTKYWSKPYYNLLIDDKAGFHPNDWKIIEERFREYPELVSAGFNQDNDSRN